MSNIKQPIGTQLTKQNMIMFLAANVSFLNQCYDVYVITYATTKKLKSKAFTVNSQNIK